MKKSILPEVSLYQGKKYLISLCIMLGLSACSSLSHNNTTTLNQPTLAGNVTDNIWEGNPATIWNGLEHSSTHTLTAMQSQTQDPTQKAWIQLALLTKQKDLTTSQFAHALMVWHKENPTHPANQFLTNANLAQLQTLAYPKQIAVLVPQSGSYASSGQAVREGFLNAYYNNQANVTEQNVKFYDTQSKPIAALYQQATAEGATVIVGPLTKDQVDQLTHSATFSVPTLALNYTPNANLHNFYEYGLLPEDEAGQIALRARRAHLGNALIIAPEDAWGHRLATAFSTHWQALGGTIRENWYYTSQTNFNQDIANLLHVDPRADKALMQSNNNETILKQQRRHDFDVIFLFAKPTEARSIVPLLRYYYANDIPIYATSAVYAGAPNPIKDVDLEGVIVCDIPWKLQPNKGNDGSANRLYAVGQDAYLLSQALPRLVQLPNLPLYGTTGALTLNAEHQIHRSLPCVPIHNGLL